MGIAVEPPDIKFPAPTSRQSTGIRFGLTAVKNVGHNAIESILAARTEHGAFPTFWEFCEKVDLRLINKRVLESLIKAGALDCFGRAPSSWPSSIERWSEPRKPSATC